MSTTPHRQESYADRCIRLAMERGEFDNLPGTGEPLKVLEEEYDELWWVRRLVKREDLNALPQGLAFKKEVVAELYRIGNLDQEAEVARALEVLNGKIFTYNATGEHAPCVDLMPEDVERFMKTWRGKRSRAQSFSVKPK